jgi:hypothetical protein
MLFWQLSGRHPTFLLHIEVVANVSLVASKEENVGQLTASLVELDARSTQLNWWSSN